MNLLCFGRKPVNLKFAKNPEKNHFQHLGSVEGEHLLGLQGVSKAIRTVILVDPQFFDIPTREILDPYYGNLVGKPLPPSHFKSRFSKTVVTTTIISLSTRKRRKRVEKLALEDHSSKWRLFFSSTKLLNRNLKHSSSKLVSYHCSHPTSPPVNP